MEKIKAGDMVIGVKGAESLSDCNKAIISAKNDIGKNLFILGAALKAVRDGELYKESCETFLEYLGQPEISLARSTMAKAIKCYEVFKDRIPQVAGVDFDKLYLITGMVKATTPEEFGEWIERAKLLSRSDLRDVIRAAKGKPPKHSLSFREKAAQFLDDMYPKENRTRKAFILKVLEDFELWKNS